MKAFLISDNHDTLVLMKLAGIKGVVAHGREESLKAFSQALSMRNLGVLLVTEIVAEVGLCSSCRVSGLQMDSFRLAVWRLINWQSFSRARIEYSFQKMCSNWPLT